MSNLIGFNLPEGSTATHQYWWADGHSSVFLCTQTPTKLNKKIKNIPNGNHYILSSFFFVESTSLPPYEFMHNYRKYDGFFGSFRPIFKHRNLVINDPIEFVEMAQWHKSNIQNMCNSSNILLLLLCFFFRFSFLFGLGCIGLSAFGFFCNEDDLMISSINESHKTYRMEKLWLSLRV